MSNATHEPPVDTVQHQPEYGPGAERLAEGRRAPGASPQMPKDTEGIAATLKSYDPEEGYLTRHEPTVPELIDTEGAPYSDKDQRKYDVNKSILEAAKEFLFIADNAGEPMSAVSTPGQVHMVWDDGSVITIRFEARRGELGAASSHPSELERKSRNRAYDQAVKVREALQEHKKQARGAKGGKLEAQTVDQDQTQQQQEQERQRQEQEKEQQRQHEQEEQKRREQQQQPPSPQQKPPPPVRPQQRR